MTATQGIRVLRWAPRRICDEDFDVGAFMWDFHQTLNIKELPDGETVLCVRYPELQAYNSWWLVINSGVVDLCTDDPGRDVDLYITSDLTSMIELWMGDVAVKAAIASNTITLTGAAHLIRTARHWFPQSSMAGIRPARLME